MWTPIGNKIFWPLFICVCVCLNAINHLDPQIIKIHNNTWAICNQVDCFFQFFWGHLIWRHLQYEVLILWRCYSCETLPSALHITTVASLDKHKLSANYLGSFKAFYLPLLHWGCNFPYYCLHHAIPSQNTQSFKYTSRVNKYTTNSMLFPLTHNHNTILCRY